MVCHRQSDFCDNFNFHCGVLVDLQFVCCCGHVKIAPQQQAASSHRGASTPLAPQRPLFSRNFEDSMMML
jgi:hypothetical protein